MNKTFYNNRYTIIAKKNLGIDFGDEVDVYYGDIQKQAYKIKKYELDNDQFYSGHIIINSPKVFKKLIKEKRSLLPITRKVLNLNNCFVNSVNHSGVHSECSIDDSIIFCSSWVLPILAENKRTQNSLYGDLFVHRIQINQFNDNLI